MKRHILSILLVFMTLCVCCGITVSAVEPRYAYTTSVSSYLTISNNKASCISTVSANSTVTKISATQYLQKKNGSNWSTVSNGTWSNSSSNNSLTMSNSKSSLSTGTYRLKTVFKVYSGSDYETITKYSSEKAV